MELKRFKIDIFENEKSEIEFASKYLDTIEEVKMYLENRKKETDYKYVTNDLMDNVEYRNKIVEIKRKEEYEKAGITFEAIAEAIIEKESGSSDKLNELIALRNSIKEQHSKE